MMNTITNIIQAIEDVANTAPQTLAYESENERHTYGELQKRSNQIARFLMDEVLEEGPIVVYGGQEFEMLAAFIGCSKAGHAYIPIETHTPLERLEMILNVAEPVAILHADEWVAEVNAPVYTIDQIEGEECTDWPGLAMDATYYIIFTSGTTGVPKGVQISHRNLLSFVNWERTDFYLHENERFLSQAPFSFDLSVMSLYPALTSGGTLIPLTKAIINDFQKLFSVLPTLDLNVWVSTPSFMDICLMEPSFDAKHLPNLTHFLFCGEELTYQTAAKLRERFPNTYLYNTYGPTEATVAVSGLDITTDILDRYHRLPIGYVKEDTRVVIMDDGQVLPQGESGEMIIVGPSVSKGYLNNPEKTAEAFFEFEGMPAYHTGDKGYMDENGCLFYEGRIDFQIKFHGYRMELEDIDHHLNKVSYVKQSAVVPQYGADKKVQKLVAYIVPEENSFEKDYQLTKVIKQELAENVMDYMIPQKYIYVKQLPLTPNGKIDRKGLMSEVNR